MANGKGLSTKKDILATEFAAAIVRHLQRDNNYDEFVGGRDTGGVTLLKTAEGTTRLIVDLGVKPE